MEHRYVQGASFTKGHIKGYISALTTSFRLHDLYKYEKCFKFFSKISLVLTSYCLESQRLTIFYMLTVFNFFNVYMFKTKVTDGLLYFYNSNYYIFTAFQHIYAIAYRAKYS